MTDQFIHFEMKPFLAGACAGMAVDLSLFPIDTIKTRLQSPQGFWNAGGFRNIYSGIGSAAYGSAPGAALFFFTYESSKKLLKNNQLFKSQYAQYSIAAATGETIACLVRVPMEVVKQRAQVNKSPSLTVFRKTFAKSGFRGFYQGYGSTIMREIPFSLIQFPLWEFLKNSTSQYRQKDKCNSFESMLCGSVAGGISAFLTTPLDVLKTRVMLSNYGSNNSTVKLSYMKIFSEIYKEKGIRGLFMGATPRVIWISFGGSIFLGGYDFLLNVL